MIGKRDMTKLKSLLAALCIVGAFPALAQQKAPLDGVAHMQVPGAYGACQDGTLNCFTPTGDSSPAPQGVTLAAGTLNSGNALGLFTIPLARYPGGGAIITSFLWKSLNGDATAKQAKIWSAKPVNTTCTNGTAFVASDVDDAYLVGPGIINFTPAAPTVTAGDAATYYNLTGITWDFRNQDSAPIAGSGQVSNGVPPSVNIYMCVIAGASDTLDVSHAVRPTFSGPQS